MSEESILLRLAAAGKEAPRVRLDGGEADEGATAPGAVHLRRRGRFEILGALAEGGVGEVVKARDIDLGRDVAIKILRRAHAEDPGLVQRFVEEAQIGGQLQHPGIVPVYELGLEDGRPFFAMKLVKGTTLAAALKSDAERPDERRLLSVFEQVCRTVAYAHARGVVHRDLKPSNLMIGAFGEVHVLDWGFAKVLRRGGLADERPVPSDPPVTEIATVRTTEGSVSVAGSVMGTPAYMPPEQAMGRVDLLDARTDVFSLGAILCEVLTGSPPYVGDDLLVQAMQGRLGDAYERLDRCGAAGELVALAKECLRPLRKERPHNAAILARRVHEHLAAAEERAHRGMLEATRARHSAEHARAEAGQERRRRRLSVMVAASVLLALVVGGTTTLWRRSIAREDARRVHGAIAAALEEARSRQGEGRLDEARAAAERAVELARGPGVDDAVRSSSDALLREIADEADAAAALQEQRTREADLVARLEEVRLGLGDAFDVVSADRRYSEILGDLDAARLSAEYPNVLQEIAAALDEWAWLRRKFLVLEGSDWRSVVALARAIDPDDWRDRMRDAVATKDLDALHTLAQEAAGADLSVRTLDLLGLALMNAGDPQGARRFYANLQPAHPDDFWINFRAGVWSFQGEDPDAREVSSYIANDRYDAAGAREAVRYLTAALALRPESATALVELGLAFQYMNPPRLEDAARTFRRAIDVRDGSYQVHYNLGRVLLQLRRFDEAADAFRDAIKLRPDDPWPHCSLGIALHRKGDLPGAIAAYRDAIRLQPDFAGAYYSLGGALAMAGNREDAVGAYEAAIRFRPDHAESYCCLGDVLQKIGRYRDALDAYRKGDELGSKREHWPYPSHQCVLRMERIVAVEGRLPQLLAGGADPEDSRECLGFAELCYDKSEYGTSARLYARAFALDPSLPGDLSVGYRYSAACAAALAGTPESRAFALQQLRADLKQRAEQGEIGSLSDWWGDSDLASIRDEAALAKLPETEREEWRAFWKEVAQLVNGAAK